MKTLEKNEISKLFRFVERKRVRYKDVQIELVDHLASAIETALEKDTSLTFEKALVNVYDGFGIFGFAKIVEEKEKSATRYWRLRIWNFFKAYYRLPQALFSMGSSFLLFQLFITFPFIMNYCIGGMAVIGFLGLVYFCFINYAYDSEIRDYLFVKSYMGIVGGIIYFFTIVPLQIIDFEAVQKFSISTEFEVGIASLLIPTSFILCYILLVKIPRSIISEINARVLLMNT